MPMTSQLLYFHLGLRADDDGIVEAYNILKMTGLSEDDLRVLVAKEFVIVLNEDLVSFITDWKEHNLIRPDRKIDSIYKDLLLQIVPDVELINKKPRADNKKLLSDGQWTDNGQTKGGIGKVRLGKESIGKDSIDKTAKETKHKYGEYKHVLLTDKEYNSLITDYNETLIKEFISKMDEYIEQYGKKGYKNYNLALRKWINKDGNTTQSKEEAKKVKSAAYKPFKFDD